MLALLCFLDISEWNSEHSAARIPLFLFAAIEIPIPVPHIKIPKLNSMIKDFAKESGAFYLDYFKALNDGNNGIIKEYSNDGVHLTAKGYRVLEPMLEKALDKVLN